MRARAEGDDLLAIEGNAWKWLTGMEIGVNRCSWRKGGPAGYPIPPCCDTKSVQADERAGDKWHLVKPPRSSRGIGGKRVRGRNRRAVRKLHKEYYRKWRWCVKSKVVLRLIRTEKEGQTKEAKGDSSGKWRSVRVELSGISGSRRLFPLRE